MSLWDIVAGISTSKQLNDNNKSFWKKFNSASVDLINGDGLAFTNEGGYTRNIFGANVSFVCDLESLLEGAIATKWHGHLAEGVLGAIFGPGANNNIVIGNSLNLNYMVGHSNNFSVMRGKGEVEVTYSPWQVGKVGSDGSPITSTSSVAMHRHRFMWLAIAAFALLVAGFDIALNVMKNKIDGEEEQVHEDEAEVEKYKAILEAEQQEAEAHGQVVNPDAGGVPVDPTHAQEELEHAEHQYHTDEGTLKKTETSYEWTIFSSIVAENRGIWLLKFLEHLCANVKTVVEAELPILNNKVLKISDDTEDEGDVANLQAAVDNLEDVILRLGQLIALKPSQAAIGNLENQKTIASDLAKELRDRIENLKSLRLLEALAYRL